MESKQQTKTEERSKDGTCKKDCADTKKVVPVKKRNKFTTEYTTEYTEQPFSAREPILPKAHFHMNATKGVEEICGPVTEYNSSFFGKPYARVEPIVPKSQLDWATGKFVDGTTTKSDYVSYTVKAPTRYGPPEWQKPDGSMEFATSYSEEFPPKPVKPVASIRPNLALRLLDAKFKGEPTYNSDYRQWKLPDPPKRFQQVEYQPPSVPFEAEQSYSIDFIPRPLVKTEPFKPVSNGLRMLGDHPFSDSTDYKESYVKYSVSPRQVHQQEQYSPPKVPLDGITSNMLDFIPLPLTKVESVKPKNALEVPSAKMEDSTTTKSHYVEWPVERFRPKWERPKWQRPTEHGEYSTTSAEEFKPYDIKPIKRIRPPSRNRGMDLTFSSSTQYNEDYPHWGNLPRVKPIIQQSYLAPTAPFVGTSTYMTTFVTHPWEKPLRIKKDNKSNVFLLLESEDDAEDGIAV